MGVGDGGVGVGFVGGVVGVGRVGSSVWSLPGLLGVGFGLGFDGFCDGGLSLGPSDGFVPGLPADPPSLGLGSSAGL